MRTSRRLVMASGLPQLKPRLAPSGMLASSFSEYPNDLAIASLYWAFVLREAVL